MTTLRDPSRLAPVTEAVLHCLRLWGATASDCAVSRSDTVDTIMSRLPGTTATQVLDALCMLEHEGKAKSRGTLEGKHLFWLTEGGIAYWGAWVQPHKFDEAMKELCRVAKREYAYNPTRFIQMLGDYGGVGAAKRLLADEQVQEGFSTLWECGRLDLTVEAHVVRPEFASLFTEGEVGRAKERLLKYDEHYFDSRPITQTPGKALP